MQSLMQANNAYRAATAHRSLREQEAEIFRQALGGLRAARDGDPIQRVRALADNRRLWMAVLDLARDPQNALPEGTKAGLVSIALAVEREHASDNPSFDFLIEMNQHIAEGLSAGA
ncbi:MAG: hypothetical protein JSR21_01010 [Proteobacteria bacterium]|nr:hypothetical protein [Pseudomonadota bacterium]